MTHEAGDVADLRSCMRRVASTVAVITSRSQDEPFGITATSITSVSLDPPAILVCVHRSVRIHRAIVEAGAFRVNYLAREQQEIADIFGTSRSEGRFIKGTWDMGAECGARLDGTLAQMTCALDRAIEYGTHTIFIGAVETAEVQAEEPLLYCNGGYASLAA